MWMLHPPSLQGFTCFEPFHQQFSSMLTGLVRRLPYKKTALEPNISKVSCPSLCNPCVLDRWHGYCCIRACRCILSVHNIRSWHLQETLEFHWGKHHQTYVTNLNGQLDGKDLINKPLEEVNRASC